MMFQPSWLFSPRWNVLWFEWVLVRKQVLLKQTYKPPTKDEWSVTITVSYSDNYTDQYNEKQHATICSGVCFLATSIVLCLGAESFEVNVWHMRHIWPMSLYFLHLNFNFYRLWINFKIPQRKATVLGIWGDYWSYKV